MWWWSGSGSDDLPNTTPPLIAGSVAPAAEVVVVVVVVAVVKTEKLADTPTKSARRTVERPVKPPKTRFSLSQQSRPSTYGTHDSRMLWPISVSGVLIPTSIFLIELFLKTHVCSTFIGADEAPKGSGLFLRKMTVVNQRNTSPPSVATDTLGSAKILLSAVPGEPSGFT